MQSEEGVQAREALAIAVTRGTPFAIVEITRFASSAVFSGVLLSYYGH